MVAKSLTPVFDSDRPLGSDGIDRFGFRQIASNLASSILSQSPDDGYVVAVQGSWGSGKSTLIKFLEDELTKAEPHSPKVIRFQPWIVGTRDGMLNELMTELSVVVEKIKGEDGLTGKEVVDSTGQLRKQVNTENPELRRQAKELLAAVKIDNEEEAGE